MLTEEQVRAYLDRIGIDEVPDSTLQNLHELIYAHQTHVPFETVGIVRNGVADLDLDALYDKMVVRKLGGYCFELNKLFEALLAALGYQVRPALSRAIRGRSEFRYPINHRGILVQLPEGLFSADVGFGGPMPAGALALVPNVEQVICGETFIAVPRDESWWNIDRITRAGLDAYDDGVPERRQTELELCTVAVEDKDFDALSLACCQPGTLFREHEIVNLRTDDGYRGFKDGALTVKHGGDKQVTEHASADAANAALLEHFGMDYR